MRLLPLIVVLAIVLGPQFVFAFPVQVPLTTPHSGIGYGVLTIGAPDRLDRAKNMGFNWIKLLVAWRNVQPTNPNVSDWSVVDGDVDRATQRGMKILLRVDQPPTWATGDGAYNSPPIDDNTLATFMGTIAARYKGRVQAYEIWNEPNTSLEWGGRPPDPAKFARMLKALAPKVRESDPDATIVSGGLATTGDAGTGEAWDDLLYLRAMYENGVKGSIDAVGSHPYAGSLPPEAPKEAAGGGGLYFRRTEEHRLIVEQYGDNAAIWPTELGWLYNQNPVECRLETYDPFRVNWQLSAATQGDYLRRSYDYARANWPWTGPLFLYNLDFAVDPWRVSCDPNRFFSVVDAGGNPLPSFNALKDMVRYESGRPVAVWNDLLSVYSSPEFEISWRGFDSGSGISSYQAQYRILPGNEWKSFRDYYVDGDQLNHTAYSSLLVETQDQQMMAFRLRPMDLAGNVGDWVESSVVAVSSEGYAVAEPASLLVSGKPGETITRTLRLINGGGSPLSWNLAPNRAGWQVAPASGALVSGASTTVVVTGTLESGVGGIGLQLTTDGWQPPGFIPVVGSVGIQATTLFIPAVGTGGTVLPIASSGPIRRVRAR